MSKPEEYFDVWWSQDGQYLDPDTEAVPWFYKREGLAEMAFQAGMAASARIAASEAENAALRAESFQSRVAPFMHECFGSEISSNTIERADRFLEEALELAQAIYIKMLFSFPNSIPAELDYSIPAELDYYEYLRNSNDLGRTRAKALVDYVFNREAGELAQEVGGVQVTLAALCLATGINMHEAGEIELARILQPDVMAKIRKKQEAKKDIHGALP